MKKSPAKPTTAGNLEEKFDRGDDVLDYFAVKEARTLMPGERRAASSPPKMPSETAVVREEAALYDRHHNASKRTLIKPNGDARYIRRDEKAASRKATTSARASRKTGR